MIISEFKGEIKPCKIHVLFFLISIYLKNRMINKISLIINTLSLYYKILKEFLNCTSTHVWKFYTRIYCKWNKVLVSSWMLWLAIYITLIKLLFPSELALVWSCGNGLAVITNLQWDGFTSSYMWMILVVYIFSQVYERSLYRLQKGNREIKSWQSAS